MPDLSEFKALSVVRSGRCKVRGALDSLEEAPRRALEAAIENLSDPDCEHNFKGIELWLANRGHKVPWQSVRTHHHQDCACHDS